MIDKSMDQQSRNKSENDDNTETNSRNNSGTDNDNSGHSIGGTDSNIEESTNKLQFPKPPSGT